ncbi:MAG: hydantoinase B/oxoprolinase family protein, partial [Gammaproteobacteria bacterium]
LAAVRHEIRTDSMGAGETRGGPGVVWHVRPQGTGQVDNYAYGDGMRNPPFGVFGGKAADGGALYRLNTDGTRTFFSMIGYFRVREGEAWISLSTGGGGYGNPLRRAPEKVRDDVRDGFVSLTAARTEYGVVLDAETLTIDDAATAALRRSRLVAEAPAIIVPDRADAGDFYRRLMQPGDRFELDPRPAVEAAWTL